MNNACGDKLFHRQAIWKANSLEIGNPPLPNADFYIVTVSKDAKSRHSPFKLSLTFTNNPKRRDDSLEVKSDRITACNSHFFSHEGKNFIFIKVATYYDFISKMLIFSDYNIQIKGVTHVYCSNLCWPYFWLKKLSNLILKNEIPCDLNIHYCKLEPNTEITIEKTVRTDLPYILEIPSSDLRQSFQKNLRKKQLALEVTEQIFQKASCHQDGSSGLKKDYKTEDSVVTHVIPNVKKVKDCELFSRDNKEAESIEVKVDIRKFKISQTGEDEKQNLENSIELKTGLEVKNNESEYTISGQTITQKEELCSQNDYQIEIHMDSKDSSQRALNSPLKKKVNSEDKKADSLIFKSCSQSSPEMNLENTNDTNNGTFQTVTSVQSSDRSCQSLEDTPKTEKAAKIKTDLEGKEVNIHVGQSEVIFQKYEDSSSIPNEAQPKESIQLNNSSLRPTYMRNEYERVNSQVSHRQNNVNLKQKSQGVIGLKNYTFSCFIHSVLQCLFNTDPLAQYFLEDHHNNSIFYRDGGKISYFFGKMLQKVKCCEEYPTPEKDSQVLEDLVNAIRFFLSDTGQVPRKGIQGDAIEFLKAFLGSINEELNRNTEKAPYKQLPNRFPEEEIQQKSEEWSNYMASRESSIVTDLFGGQLLNIKQCQRCKDKMYSFDTFWDIALAFKEKKYEHTLEDLLSNFLKEEGFAGHIECEKCGSSKITLSTQIWKLPQILVFTFKRFRHNYGYEKINDYVNFPVKNFDISPFITQSKDITTTNSVYSLFGYVKHMGTLSGGHYIAKCRNRYDQKWYEHDDNDVYDCNLNDDMKRDRSAPLILFYMKNN